MRQIVEVLLNQPEHYPAVRSILEPGAIGDAGLARVAEELTAMLETHEPFRVDELIGRLQSVELAGLITDLQASGERRSGYGAVIEGAIDCLDAFERSKQTAALADEIRRERRQTNENDDVPDGEDERLKALAASARNPHFAAARSRRRTLNQ